MQRRILILAALLLACFLPVVTQAGGVATEADQAEAADTPPARIPRTQAEWRERVDALTPGMTPKQVAAALGCNPDTTRKTGPRRTRQDYHYFVECSDNPGWLILRFVDGVYASAQW